jgi:hypothetical protein
MGKRFWRPDKHSTTTFAKKVGFWVRILDPMRAGNWNVNRWEGRLTQIAAPVLRLRSLRHPPGVGIRSFQAADLARCLELANLATSGCDLKLVWTAERLGHQLGQHGFGQALVAEVNGKIQGCIGYHVLPMLGRRLENAGILDLMFVTELSPNIRTELLNSVLLRLQQDNAVVALKLRGGDYPASTFLRWGWVWKPADSDVLITWANDVRQIPRLRKLHLLWR